LIIQLVHCAYVMRASSVDVMVDYNACPFQFVWINNNNLSKWHGLIRIEQDDCMGLQWLYIIILERSISSDVFHCSYYTMFGNWF
jgi:hypothetical protein